MNINGIVLVLLSTMKVSHRFALFSYNFSSVLSFNYRSQGFEVSTLTSISNCLKLPLAITFSLYLFVTPDFYKKIMVEEIKMIEVFSFFSALSMLFSTLVTMFTTFTICFVNLKKRNEILKFLNKANLLRKCFLEKKFSKSFEKSLGKVTILVNSIILIYIVMQFSYMKNNLSSVFVSFVILYPFVILLNFLGFIKIFEYFFVNLLQSFKKDIDEVSSNELMINFKIISDLSQEFNDIFGFQLTAVTCCNAVMTTVDVSFIENHRNSFALDRINFLSFFKHFKL